MKLLSLMATGPIHGTKRLMFRRMIMVRLDIYLIFQSYSSGPEKKIQTSNYSTMIMELKNMEHQKIT